MSEDKKPLWEIVGHPQDGPPWISRFEVPGGWIYRLAEPDSVAVCFVPKPVELVPAELGEYHAEPLRIADEQFKELKAAITSTAEHFMSR